MSDADCRFLSPRTLSVAVRYALDNACDMLSILPVLEMRGFWENLVQPVCAGVMMIWFRPEKVNDPAQPNAYANGAFMLIRRSAYDAVGGHEAVKAEVNEDMHLADRVKRAGLRLRVVRSEGLCLSRMYTSLGAILRGWSRIFYGTFGTPGRLATTLAVVCVVSLYPYLAAAVGLSLAGAGVRPAGAWWACGAAASAALLVQLSVIWRFYRWARARPGLFWAYPAAVIVTIIALIGSFGKLRRGSRVVWRSTTYTKS
jgi:hypothetical protein